jgi:hypothetical protein
VTNILATNDENVYKTVVKAIRPIANENLFYGFMLFWSRVVGPHFVFIPKTEFSNLWFRVVSLVGRVEPQMTVAFSK